MFVGLRLGLKLGILEGDFVGGIVCIITFLVCYYVKLWSNIILRNKCALTVGAADGWIVGFVVIGCKLGLKLGNCEVCSEGVDDGVLVLVYHQRDNPLD